MKFKTFSMNKNILLRVYYCFLNTFNIFNCNKGEKLKIYIIRSCARECEWPKTITFIQVHHGTWSLASRPHCSPAIDRYIMDILKTSL